MDRALLVSAASAGALVLNLNLAAFGTKRIHYLAVPALATSTPGESVWITVAKRRHLAIAAKLGAGS